MSDSAARRARITAGALDAAVAVARAHGVRVDAPVVLNDLFSVVVHLGLLADA